MKMLRTLKKGSSGADVRRVQQFLTGQGFPCGLTDGKFGERTESAVIKFQRANSLDSLKPDGIIGRHTWNVMIRLGIDIVFDGDKDTPHRPPNVKPLTNNEQRMRRWGRFEYRSAPTASNPERIIIEGYWWKKNITSITCPFFNKSVNLHREVADDYIKLIEEIKRQKLTHLLLTHEGAQSSRFIRGSRSVLSNHAWGTAFDINYRWNQLGAVPTYAGEHGSVREIVPIALEYNWYWGGWFSRRDGMHFEHLG